MRFIFLEEKARGQKRELKKLAASVHLVNPSSERREYKPIPSSVLVSVRVILNLNVKPAKKLVRVKSKFQRGKK